MSEVKHDEVKEPKEKKVCDFCRGSGWDDMKCIGEVTEFIGQAEPHTVEAANSRACDEDYDRAAQEYYENYYD